MTGDWHRTDWTAVGAGLRRLVLAMSVSSFALLATPAYSVELAIGGQVAGEARELDLSWDGSVGGRATQVRKRVKIQFHQAVEADMAAIADTLGSVARIVQLSADGRTISVNLQQGFQAYTRDGEGRLTVTIAPARGRIPAASKKLTETGVTFGAAAPPVSHTASDQKSTDKHADAAHTDSDEHEGQHSDDHDTDLSHTSNLETAELPQEIAAEPELSVGTVGGNTRLVFRHPMPVPYEAVLEEGQLTLAFEWPKDVRLTQLNVQPPPVIKRAAGRREDGEFIAQLVLLPGTGVRHYQEGTDTIVDLIPPKEDHLAVTGEAGHASEGGDEMDHGVADYGDPLFDDGQTVVGLNVAGDGEGSSGEGKAELTAHHDVPTVVTFATTGVGVQFRFGELVPAAISRRGERLWIAFAGDGSVDLSGLATLEGEGIRSAQQFQSLGGIVVGLTLDPQVLVTAIPEDLGWKLNLGDSILTPTPSVGVQRVPGEDGGQVIINLEAAGSVTRFKDPDVGDELIFVMAGSPVQGLISQREFADFHLMSTAQGLVVNPKADGIDVQLDDQQVIITRERGLNLSGPDVAALVHAELPEAIGHSLARLNFTEWRGDPSVSFGRKHEILLKKVADAHEAVRASAELDLAKFLLSYGLYEEARGLLKVIAVDDPSIVNEPTFRTMRAVANLMTQHNEKAAADLNSKDMPNDSHGKLWKAMLAATEARWPDARLLFEDAEWAIPLYGNDWQARFRIAATRSGLAVNDLGVATRQMELMPLDVPDKRLAAEVQVIRGRLAEALEQFDKAAAIYKEMAASSVEPVAAEAELHRLRLALHMGEIDVAEALDQLEALRFRWRGDATEMETLIELGELYTKIGDYRHGLNTLRIAVRNFPGTVQQRRASQKMTRIFEDLYLHGEADKLPPVQALGLYYDFKELTPVGANGDLMIRHLADRLVDMDLLDQATDLLKHQVENRLRGVARSQVAIKLAMIELINNKPESALRTIQTTRQARLPDTVARQRRLLEARALLEVGRYDHALDVIEIDDGTIAERMRADIYWESERWPESAQTLTALVETTLEVNQTLDEYDRFDVMRAAIALTLSSNNAGLETLRRQFSEQMAQTPDARAFDIIAAKELGRSVEFRTLVERVAAVDTLERFLRDMKAEGAGEPSGT